MTQTGNNLKRPICIDYVTNFSAKSFNELFYYGNIIGRALTRHEIEDTTEYEDALRASFELKGRQYKAYLNIGKTEDNPAVYVPSSIYFEWTDNDIKRHTTIKLLRRKLGSHYYYIFQCPYSHTPCRKLYVDSNGYLFGRRTLTNYHYKSQYEYTGKTILSMQHAVFYDPSKRYGKEYYRGKLTPYGRKLLKFDKKYEQFLPKLVEDSKAYFSKKAKDSIKKIKPLVLKA